MSRSVFDVNGQLQSIERKIVVALERISEAFRVLLWEEAKEHSLSPIQVQLLIFCAYHAAEKRKVGFTIMGDSFIDNRSDNHFYRKMAIWWIVV